VEISINHRFININISYQMIGKNREKLAILGLTWLRGGKEIKNLRLINFYKTHRKFSEKSSLKKRLLEKVF
jgi:hypothetical protein